MNIKDFTIDHVYEFQNGPIIDTMVVNDSNWITWYINEKKVSKILITKKQLYDIIYVFFLLVKT